MNETGPFAGARVLVVEDELDVQHFIAQLLRLQGAVVSTASTGADALARMHDAGPFHLVTLDLGLPDITGWQVLEAIRVLHASQRECSVVILSATADKDTTDRASALGAGFVAKPVAARELLAALAPHIAASLDGVS